jgi:hypothetical protein
VSSILQLVGLIRLLGQSSSSFPVFTSGTTNVFHHVKVKYVVKKFLRWICDELFIHQKIASSLFNRDEIPKKRHITDFIRDGKNFHHGRIFHSVTRRKNITKLPDPRVSVHAGSWRGAIHASNWCVQDTLARNMASCTLANDVSGGTCRKEDRHVAS